MTRRLLAPVLLALWPALVLAGCGDATVDDPEPHAEVTTGASGGGQDDVHLVEDDEADLVLHVSNQSFDDEEVNLTILVDGSTVVDGQFHVEDQHNWVTFPLAVDPGLHEVTATADSGTTLRESFRIPQGQVRYAVIDHWGERGSAELTWFVRRQPIAFA